MPSSAHNVYQSTPSEYDCVEFVAVIYSVKYFFTAPFSMLVGLGF